VLVAIQVSIFIPVGLIIQSLVPAISRPRALGLGLIGVSGAMMMTELGTTMGDIPPAILMAWALYLLLSVMAQQAVRAERRAVIAGLLVGGAVALKFTVVCLFPGLLVLAIALVIAGKRRSAMLFFLTSAAVAVILCAPWAIVLQTHMGSPVFPMFNGFFQAPRVPAVNMGDSRFPVVSLGGLVKLPIRQALGTAYTSEEYIRDVRWAMGFVAVGLGMAAIALGTFRPGTRAGWRASLPGLTLMVFWCVSYVTWAFEFGTQRYAMLLEVLALPIIAVGFSLALPRLPTSRASLPMLLLLAVSSQGPPGSWTLVDGRWIGRLSFRQRR
jgi:4-amino-4-deoxy-L-arabinose transferase-like glycosyltransferase